MISALFARRCPFLTFQSPGSSDANEPVKLAQTIADMALRYVSYHLDP